jgi:hypothetical protein
VKRRKGNTAWRKGSRKGASNWNQGIKEIDCKAISATEPMIEAQKHQVSCQRWMAGKFGQEDSKEYSRVILFIPPFCTTF